MRDLSPITEPLIQPPKDATMVLFLGLFLLVLAFFILLVSISTIEEVKSEAVMESLTSTFQTVLPRTLSPEDFQTLDGDIIASTKLQDDVAQIFATTLQIARVEILQPGRLMRVHLQSRAVFEDDSIDIRPSMMPLFERVVTAISSRVPGLRFDLEAVINVAPIDEKSMPVEQGLQMARAGAFARTLLERGIPPDSIAVGLHPSTTPDMVLWFYVRRIDDVGSDLEVVPTTAPLIDGANPGPPAEAVPTQDGDVGLNLPSLGSTPAPLAPANP